MFLKYALKEFQWLCASEKKDYFCAREENVKIRCAPTWILTDLASDGRVGVILSVITSRKEGQQKNKNVK